MRAALPLACALLLFVGCGQKGALYLPDKNATVVTSAPATSAAPAAPATTPPAKKTADEDAEPPPPK